MPAVSKSQQRLFGQVHAFKKGKLRKPSPQIERIAKGISDEDSMHFAATEHKDLPEKSACYRVGWMAGRTKEANGGTTPASRAFVDGLKRRMQETGKHPLNKGPQLAIRSLATKNGPPPAQGQAVSPQPQVPGAMPLASPVAVSGPPVAGGVKVAAALKPASDPAAPQNPFLAMVAERYAAAKKRPTKMVAGTKDVPVAGEAGGISLAGKG